MAGRLNDRQLEAVRTTEGPLLIIAGAGSGKTTVIVNRIAYMIDEVGINPYNIMAITFTNKAASEMRERIENIIGSIPKGMWVGTFHSICVKILRRCIDKLDYRNDFVIYDSNDVKILIKDCIQELGFDTKEYSPNFVASEISSAKNKMIDPATFDFIAGVDFTKKNIAKIYGLYQKKLKNNNALDFDDIIFFTVRILSENPDILDIYSDRFRYIMVDEYQDTDNSQYLLVKLLSEKHRNIAVVGDDDQSIYSFRGADVGNILGFEDDYPEAKRVVLDKNYRSTENILKAANAVIANNENRMGKNLWSDNGIGDKICVYTADNEKVEGRFIAAEIIKKHNNGKRYKDCAVLYRTNAQSRAIETELISANIPYKILSGLRFYDRKEIKDILAYMRLIHNTDDDLSFIRVINEPKRKIGSTSVDKLNKAALRDGISIFEAAKKADTYPELKAAAQRIIGFTKLIESLRNMKDKIKVSELLEKTEQNSGYIDALMTEATVESRTRIENLKELMTVVKEFENESEINGFDNSLAAFMEMLTLSSSVDDIDDEEDAVILMTIHSAKGLEFPVVFIAGMEERIFPGFRSMGNSDMIAEERRLCYVAMTRAKENLYITKTIERSIYGKTETSTPSRFLREIPEEFTEERSSKRMRTYEYIPEPVKKKQTWSGGTSFKKKSSGKFHVGDRVHHNTFGDGTVLKVDANSTATALRIQFDTAGVKTILAEYAKLEKIL